MSSYTSTYPDWPVDPAIKQFYEEFYKTSDTPDAHEKYPEYFTENATLTIASKTAKGKDEILAMRKGMWEYVARRKHVPIKIFPFGPNADEIMLYGTVDYGLKNGKSANAEWAARADLVKDGSGVKMSYYQVYLDTAAQAAAK